MATKPNEPAPSETPAPEKKSGGGNAWLPLIITLVTMPALAYGMTTFVLLPKLQKTLGTAAAEPEKHAGEKHGGEKHGEPAKSAKSGESGKGAHGEKATGAGRSAVPINKILVNLSGSMGTRYLVTSLSLVGDAADFKEEVEKHLPQLTDLAGGVLGTKTMAELEKPGARNIIRTELLAVFNNALGETSVKELYLTEFAVQ